jgi:hypothetical protein
MGVFRKAAICLLITALFAGAFSALAWFRLFDFIEVEFYAPVISRDAAGKLTAETRLFGTVFKNLSERFSGALQNDAVRRSVSLNQNELDIFERSRIFGELLTVIPSLQWVRLIDISGSRSRIHFSTENTDYIIRSDNTAAYRAWTEVPHYIPITDEMLSDSGGIVFDALYERLIFYIPFSDMRNIKRGVALFAVSSRIIDETLFAGSFIKISEPVSIVSDPDGILIGLREAADAALRETVAGIWKSGIITRSVVRSSTNHTFVLFSKQTEQNIFIGFLVDEQLFAIPRLLKIIMLICFCVTVFTISFFIMNIKQDAVIIVQNRMKNLQVNLYREYCEHKIDMNWLEWKRELARRREDVRAELRRGFSARKSKEVDEYIHSFFDKCWDELIAVISNQTKDMMERLDEEKIEDILKRILEASAAIANARTEQYAASQPRLSMSGGAAPVEELSWTEERDMTGEPDEFEGADELDEVAEFEEADGPGELEELDDSEEMSGLEELIDSEEEDELEELDTGQVSPKTEATGIMSISASIIDEIKTKAELEKAEQEQIELEKLKEQEQARLRLDEEDKKRILEKVKIKEREAIEMELAGTVQLLENDPFDSADSILSDDAENPDLSYGDFVGLDIPAKQGGSSKTPAGEGLPPFTPVNGDSDPFAGIDGAEIFLEDTAEIIGDDISGELSEAMELETADDTDELDDLDELEEASEEDLAIIKEAPTAPDRPVFTFEDPHKGSDINKLAMAIEFSKPPGTKDWEHDFEMDMVIASPENELFNSIGTSGNDTSSPQAAANDVIDEKNGVPFIKTKEEPEEKLDANMKNLVNSVLKR